jgi:ferritin-like metal-binding protein YciE
VMEEFADGPALDAGLIAAAQAVEHYEIARYGALRSWAELASLDDAADLLDETLAEEKETDALLTKLAEDQANLQSA